MEALLFSGGKDSVACLFLLQAKWDNLIVLWANTGKNIPEIINMIDEVRRLVPNFVEIKTDQEEQNRANGLPSDIVPLKYFAGHEAETSIKAPFLIQSYLNCCKQNITLPLIKWCIDNGIETIYTGQKRIDKYKNCLESGDISNGLKYIFPLNECLDDEVIEYATFMMALNKMKSKLLPVKHSSIDCYDCTAYMEDSIDRVDYLFNNHKDKYNLLMNRLEMLSNAIVASHEPIKEAIEWIKKKS
jgi:3'-phosphoadenosine 5'-phosphosulfate sulfotransferase (PAPS reductase)/FAD synthetase